MLVLGITRQLLEPEKNVFKPGKVASHHRNTPEGFEEGGKQCPGFGRGFLDEGGPSPPAQLFRQWIRPERFEQGRELFETGGDRASSGRLGMFEPPRVIQQNVAGLTARR